MEDASTRTIPENQDDSLAVAIAAETDVFFFEDVSPDPSAPSAPEP